MPRAMRGRADAVAASQVQAAGATPMRRATAATVTRAGFLTDVSRRHGPAVGWLDSVPCARVRRGYLAISSAGLCPTRGTGKTRQDWTPPVLTNPDAIWEWSHALSNQLHPQHPGSTDHEASDGRRVATPGPNADFWTGRWIAPAEVRDPSVLPPRRRGRGGPPVSAAKAICAATGARRVRHLPRWRCANRMASGADVRRDREAIYCRRTSPPRSAAAQEPVFTRSRLAP
jgi:hypothetical protein